MDDDVARAPDIARLVVADLEARHRQRLITREVGFEARLDAAIELGLYGVDAAERGCLHFAALGNQLFATVALLIATLIIRQRLELTGLWLPVLLIPQVLFALGAAWLIASLGVFLRDITQGIMLLLMAWMYLTPIIYPEAIVPARFRTFINLNPFTSLIRSYRRIFLDGSAPDWRGLAYFTAFALVIFVFGYWWFARTRKSFADVV